MADAVVCPRCGSRQVKGDCPHCDRGGIAPNDPQVVVLDIGRFAKGVIRLGLATVEEMRSEASRSRGNVVNLARALVASKTLTLYQATVLLQGTGARLAVGPYLLLERGGGDSVFKARHRKTGREVAIKLISASTASDAGDGLRERLAAAAKVKHPNIAGPLGMGDDNGQTYIVMEYAFGRDLLAIVRELGVLPVDLALEALIQTGRGLAAARAAGLYHGGLDLSRLVLNANGVVRIVGLGQYATPGTDPKDDIRALGYMLHGLLTGRSPSEVAATDAKTKRAILAPSRVRDEIPESVDDACLALLGETTRTARPPQTMEQSVALLSECLPEGEAATNARAALKARALEAIKRGTRASAKGNDLSVFASGERSGLLEDPDLRLEDLVTDFRDEENPDGLAEDQLPPMLPRIAAAPMARRNPPTRLLLILGGVAAAVVGLVIAASALRSWVGSITVAEAPKVATALPKPKPNAAPKPALQPEPAPKPAPTPKPESIAPPKPTSDPSAPPRILFADVFETPRAEWVATTPEERAVDRLASRGYQNGSLFFRVNASNVWAMNVVELPSEFRDGFRCEVDTRVTNDNPEMMRTQSVIRIMTATGGVQVGLDREGQIEIWPTLRGNWNNPWFGPVTHPAIERAPGAFNRLGVEVRRHRLTVLANGKPVSPPLELAYDLLPARVEIGLDPMMSRSVAEFERVEVAELPKADSEAENAEPAAFFFQEGGLRLPDGTIVHEGGSFSSRDRNPRFEQVNAYSKKELGKWTNDRYLQWMPNRGELIDLVIAFPADGRYRVVGRFLRTRFSPKIRLDVDTDQNQRGEVVDLQQPLGPLPVDIDLGTHPFSKGMATLRFTCVSIPRPQPNGQGLLLLDELRFVPVE